MKNFTIQKSSGDISTNLTRTNISTKRKYTGIGRSIFASLLFFLIILCTSNTKAQWVNVGPPGISAGPSSYPSLVINGGVPYVAYCDDGNMGKCRVMKFNGNFWEDVGPTGISAGVAFHQSLAFDGNTPYVAFQDHANGYGVTVMKFDGTTWLNVGAQGFSGGISVFISLALEGNIPYVAFADGSNFGKCTVMKYTGSWVPVGIPGFSGNSTHTQSLALDGSTPYVFFEENLGDPYVMKYSGSWGNVGVPPIITAGAVGWTSLALDGNTPYVAYQDGGNGGKCTVMKFNGTTWGNVGNAGFSAGIAYYTRLALDGNIPYVAYQDWANGKRTTVMKFNGTTWGNVGIPGFSAGQGDLQSLALDGSTPYVAYQDWANGYKITVMKFYQPTQFTGVAAGDNYGASETGIGDFNGDGIDDFVVGAPLAPAGASNVGEVYVYFGRSPFPGSTVLPDITIKGLYLNENFGSSVGGNFDLNGDGFKDIIVGAPGWNGNTGRVYVFFGECDFNLTNPNPTVDVADLTICGENTASIGLGFKVSRAGDVNGDCLDDIIMSHPNLNGNLGKVYIIYGNRNAPPAGCIPASTANVILSGTTAGGLYGYSIADLGPINYDRYDDIIIGQPGASTGHTYTYYGGCPFNTTADQILDGSGVDDFGTSLAGLGDINGNGTRDFLVADWRYPTLDVGTVYVYDGSQTSSGVITPDLYQGINGNSFAGSNGRFGSSAAGIGDFDGNGFNDFLIGDRGYAPASGQNNRGREYRFGGGPSSAGYVFPIAPFSNALAPYGGDIMTGGANNSFVGTSSAWAGDINCDGWNDALWGASGYNAGAGAVFLDLAPSNNPLTYTTVFLRAFVQGHYLGSGIQTQTEVKVCLYDSACRLIDEKNVLLHANGDAYDATGQGIKFNNLPPNTLSYSSKKYYVVIKGMCNSIIGIWSQLPINMVRGGTYGSAGSPLNFSFGTTSSNQAYNNNQISVGTGVVAIYSGDVNDDGYIDVTDLVLIDNDAANFVSDGCCLKTDLTGDGFVDLSDYILADNNSANFITHESPCLCPSCP
ncbi:MAG: hypothetical protein WAT71_07055 [Ignavibacteria bacterium]